MIIIYPCTVCMIGCHNLTKCTNCSDRSLTDSTIESNLKKVKTSANLGSLQSIVFFLQRNEHFISFWFFLNVIIYNVG